MHIEASKLWAILRLARKAYGKYKLQIIILTVLGFVSGLLEGIGVNALIPLFSIVIGAGESTDIISRTIKYLLSVVGVPLSVGSILVFVVVMFSLKALVLIIVQYIKIKIASDYEEELRRKLFANTLRADWSFLSRQKLGHLETVIMIDVPESANLLHHISGAIMITTGLLIYALVAVNISYVVTAVTLISGGIVFLVFKPFVRSINRLSYEKIGLNKKIAHLVGENIIGIKAVKSLMAGRELSERGNLYFKKMKELMVWLSFYKSIPGSLLPAISVFFISALFAISYKSPVFGIASLVAIIYLINKIFSYVQQFQNTLFTIHSLVPHLKSVLNSEEQSIRHEEKTTGESKFSFNKELQFNNVSFSYAERKEALRDININIKKGEFIGIIGPSGGGKTTLVDMLLRLLQPTRGEITIDGKNTETIDLKEWRARIGYISQDVFLLNGTIAANIEFYNKSVTEKDIIQAAKSAQIYDFINELPDKFKTIVGERGIFLSAGQRQRIAIARVLARKPDLLVLDEATSALDNESEARVQEVMRLPTVFPLSWIQID